MPVQTAFFDLDRTLVEINTALLYARWEQREGRISPLQLVRAGAWTLGYHFSVINMERAYDQALAHYKGTPAEVLRQRTRQWFDVEVADRLLEEARAAMAMHRAAGRRLVILSNTSLYQAEIAAERWGFDDYIANRFVLDPDGALSGRFVAPLCHGRGKITHAQAWADRHGFSLDGAWFYSDSYSDVPMLAFVEHPVVVNPDPRLAKEAARRRWPIEQWRTRSPR